MTFIWKRSKNPEALKSERDRGLSAGFFTRLLAGSYRWLRRTVETVIMIVVLLAMYLGFVGIPASVLQDRLTQIQGQGLRIEIDRVKLDFIEGVAVEGVKLYATPSAAEPLFSAARLTFGFDPREWTHKKIGLRRIGIRGGFIRLNPSGRPDIKTAVVLERMRGRIRITPAGVDVRLVDSEFSGIHVLAEGIVFPGDVHRKKPVSVAELAQGLSAISTNLPGWIGPAMKQLNRVHFSNPPQVNIGFQVAAGNVSNLEVEVAAWGGSTEFRDSIVDQWSVEAQLHKGQLSVPVIVLQRNEQQCQASGQWDSRTGNMETHIFVHIIPDDWLGLLPESWSKSMQAQGFTLSSPATCEIWSGPCAVTNWSRQITGWMALRQTLVHGVWVEKGFVSFARKGNLVTLGRIDALIGRDQHQGIMQGEANYHVESREYSGRFQCGFDPNEAVSVMGKKDTELVGQLTFPKAPPSVICRLTGRVGDPQKFTVEGNAWATNFTFRGVEIARLETPVTISNGVMTLYPIRLVRKEGEAAGSFIMDFNRETVALDATSTADPYAISKLIGQKAAKIVRQFRFEGPVRVVARGEVDYNGWGKNNLDAFVEGEKMGLKWFLADRGSFHVKATGPNLDFNDIECHAYSGALSGRASFRSVDQTTNTQYDIQVSMNDIDFNSLLASMMQQGEEVYAGKLSAIVKVSGLMGEGRGKTATGDGQVSIKGGQLFRVPLLGGLSQFLSYIYPGLGFMTQTDFKSSFGIKGRKLHSDDVYLEGAIMSISGKGDYAFDGELDFTVKVIPMRESALVSVLRFVTYPVSKLLEFHLGGTLAEPHWRPVNFPKEMFLIFD